MPGPGIGPRAESLPGVDQVDQRFAATIGALTEGAYRFPRPFDLATSAALADNDLSGPPAESMFGAVRARTPARYHIAVTEVAGAQRRVVVDVVLDQQVAAALLGDVADQLLGPDDE